MTQIVNQTQALDQLAGELRGLLLRPGDDGYDDARAVWNGMVDRRPAAIARCERTTDVVAAVRAAAEGGLELSVKAGGHQAAGKAVCEDGLVIDLSPMDAVEVDPDAHTARVGAGATLGQLDAATQRFGLAVPAGVDSRTGVAGLALGGGIGWLARSFGLTSDNLIAAEVVTADGQVLSVSEDAHPDLFWALRGGGGNFAIVTSFEFRLHPVGPEVLTFQLFHPLEDAETVLRGYRDVMTDAPDALSCYALFLRVPPIEPFPAKRHGTPAVVLAGCHSGSLKEGGEAVAPLTALGDPFFDVVTAMPYTTFQSSFDAGVPDGARYYGKAHLLPELSDAAIRTLLEQLADPPGEFTMAFLESLGGAISRMPADATAWAHRDAAYGFAVQGGWTDPSDDERVAAWCRQVHATMAPHATGGVYVNYLDADDEHRTPAAYGGHHARLAEIKRRWDPNNVFKSTHNIAPR